MNFGVSEDLKEANIQNLALFFDNQKNQVPLKFII